MADAQLSVEDLSIRIPRAYGDVEVVSGASFSVDAGECVGLVGESGCGKTLTGLAILGLLPPEAVASGHIRWKGTDLIGSPARRLRQIRGREIGMIYQDALTSLNPSLPIRRQVGQLVPREHRRETVDTMLSQVALRDVARIRRSYPFELSGGQRQRALIAMGLAQQPSLIVADEPTTALDEVIEAEVMALLRELREEGSLSMLLITHNIALVSAMASRVIVMYAGQVVEQGETDQVISRPRHPYTAGLIDCIRSLEARQHPARSINGVPPDPRGFNAGCRFSPRCSRALDECSLSPPAVTSTDGRSLACYNPLPEQAR
jgi:oligopeptide/dipeptide ABC transporter ATP-binding protein